jgi:hypothetical protein
VVLWGGVVGYTGLTMQTDLLFVVRAYLLELYLTRLDQE